MYEQAEPVRSPFSGPGQSDGPPQPPPVRQSGGSRGRGRHGNGASDNMREEQEESSHTYEEAEVAIRHATADRTYPGEASGRSALCSFIHSHRSCMAAGIAVLISLVAVVLAPLTFINKEEISQLSTTVDALKLELDKERSRTAALEHHHHEIRKALLSCPKGYTMWREICYKAFNSEKTFNEAAAGCREDGGTLAMPRDAETNAFLISLHKSVNDNDVFWFGLHDRREEGSFEWVDGSALGTYNSWAPGQPDNLGNHDCVLYSAHEPWKDKWNDATCDWPLRYICQAVASYKN
ncbi:CD209 antigen-like protein E [Branchiostoma lanceolatum]|uniref:CD209 antigen-like protein E n=1 Tax=Branchiostoma lanceolatum TaxID=7740 RepID=UPI0034522CDB